MKDRRTAGAKTANTTTAVLRIFFSFLITFVLMFSTWLVLSGKFDPLLLILGGLSSFFVAYYFYDLLFPFLDSGYALTFLRFCKYLPWIIQEIVKSNFHLLYLTFHPRLHQMIDPQIVTFKTHLKTDIAITTLANSITLTPGTITVTANRDGVFKVHAVDEISAAGLPGQMLDKTAHVFGEER